MMAAPAILVLKPDRGDQGRACKYICNF